MGAQWFYRRIIHTLESLQVQCVAQVVMHCEYWSFRSCMLPCDERKRWQSRLFLCNNVARMHDAHVWHYRSRHVRAIAAPGSWWSSDVLVSGMLWSFVSTVCSPKEEFGRQNKRPDLGYHSSNKPFENTLQTACSTVQNLRLGSKRFVWEHRLCKTIQNIVAVCNAMCCFSGMQWSFVTTLQDDYKRHVMRCVRFMGCYYLL